MTPADEVLVLSDQAVFWFWAKLTMPAAPSLPTASSCTAPGCDEVSTSLPLTFLLA